MRLVRMRVAVVGAGPAGAAAALALARQGASVSLFERSAWPRSKACGDGITPSSVAELRALGISVADRVPFPSTLISAPRGGAFRAPWPTDQSAGTTMPRRAFDARLVDAAVAAGVTFRDRTAVRSCTIAGTLELQAGMLTERHAFDVVFLAEGATGGLAATCGMGTHTARLAAYRGYIAVSHDLEPLYQVHYAGALVPGYAWIFPVDLRRANVGACVVRTQDVRAELGQWIATDARAKRVLGPAPELREGAGGIIPIGRRRRVAGRVVLLGDAAGVADPLSAEGISQALGTARLATGALCDARGDVRLAGAAYERAVRVFDRNNREAFRMRRLFAWLADPLVAIARRRARFAAFVIARGYFPKRDAAWLLETFANL